MERLTSKLCPPPRSITILDGFPPASLRLLSWTGRRLLGKQLQVQPGAPGKALTTTSNLWRSIKHQEGCQHQQLIAANGEGGGQRLTSAIQMSVPKQPEGGVEAVYTADVLKGREQLNQTDHLMLINS